MLITTIVEKNMTLFEKLVPETIFEQINKPGVFGLGAIGDDEIGKFAAGVLVFSVDEGTNGEENLTAATIKWLYVAEEFRKKGAGDALMIEFLRVMDDSGMEHILCDVPLSEECDFLCAYLEEWGFDFTLANVYEMNVELGELLANPLISKHTPSDNTVPLLMVTENHFRQFMTHIKQRPDVLDSLSSEINDYDTDVSCAFMTDKDIDGIMLIQSHTSGDLEVLLMRASSNIGKAMSNMMFFASCAAAKKYPSQTQVHIVCRIEAAASVLEKLFPDKQPLLVRRGYLHNAPDLAE